MEKQYLSSTSYRFSSFCSVSYQNTCTTLIFYLFLSVLFPLSASAQISPPPAPQSYTYTKIFPDPAQCNVYTAGDGQNARAGIIRRFFARYDSVNETFTLTVRFQRCAINGALTNGFTAVFNDGPNPKGLSGELAILYADFRDPNNPIATIYGYNGQNNPFSYRDGVRNNTVNGIPGMPGEQEPDRIHSSIVDDSFIKRYVVSELPSTDEVIVDIEFSAAVINSHSPLWPVSGITWEGMQFDDLFGVWFHPFVLNDNTSYCTDAERAFPCGPATQPSTPQGAVGAGYIKNWSWDRQGWFDRSNLVTNPSPICQVAVKGPPITLSSNATLQSVRNTGCYQLEVGESVGAQLTLSDPGQSFKVDSQDDFPASLQVNPALPTSFDDQGVVELGFTAALADQGMSYFFNLLVTDQSGGITTCGVDVCVEPNGPPTCSVMFDTDTPSTCEGETTAIEFTGAGSSDPDNDPLTYQWTTDCPNANILLPGVNSPTGSLVLTDPGDGIAVDNCSLFLELSDGVYSAEKCSIPIQVDPCELDCAGDPNGNAQIDVCGVCDGDGTSCLDCADTPNGGQVVDICGVCGGDGTSCLDCAGIPFGVSVLDQCGECNGDGLSCVNCENTDIFGFQAAADSRITDLEDIIRQRIINKTIRTTERLRGSRTNNVKAWARDGRMATKELRVAGWEAAFTPNSIVTTCDENADNVCFTISNVSSIVTYEASVTDMAILAEELSIRLGASSRRLFRKRGMTKRAARRKASRIVNDVLADVAETTDEAIATINQIPPTSTECPSQS